MAVKKKATNRNVSWIAHEFATNESIFILNEFIEKQSAKNPGRPIFDEMVHRLESGEADGILAWHPDRLARNSMDGGRIIYLLDRNKIKTLKFPTFRFEPDPQGKFMLSIMFGQSKYYVDSLSENTKRGLREKVRRGEFPCRAPFGYLNDHRVHRIQMDPERAPLVRQLYERYALGTTTLDELRQYLSDSGVRSAGGKTVGRTFVSWVLSNPVYYGHFRYNGEMHEGVHDPIVTKKLFDQVQGVLNRRWRYSPGQAATATKPYLGLLRCAECGSAITAEIQKGHTYYRCTKKSRKDIRCSQKYVREEALDADISKLLRNYTLRPEWADAILDLLEKEKHQAAHTAALLAAQKEGEIAKINGRLQRLMDSLLDAIIDRTEYTAQKSRLMSEKKSLEEQKASHAKSPAHWLEPFKKWVLTAKNGGEVALTGSALERKGLASEVFGSNLVLDCKKPRGYAVKPWSFLTEKPQTGGMVEMLGIEPRCNRDLSNDSTAVE